MNLRIICMFLVCIAHGIYAGVFIESHIEAMSGASQKMVSMIYVDSDRVRIDTQDLYSHRSFIYRQDKDVFWVIDHIQKTVTIIDSKVREKMKTRMANAMLMYEEKIKTLPKEQQLAMKQWMAKQVPSIAAPPKLTYKKVKGS